MSIEIIKTHDSIKLKTKLWGFAINRASISPSGTLPSDIFDKFLDIVILRKGTHEECIKHIHDNINTLWPEWNVNKEYFVGDKIEFEFKTSNIPGVITKVNAKNVLVDCSLGKNISIPKGLLI